MYEYGCVLRRVIDGDSLELDIDLGFDTWLCKQNVRLVGVDAPEIKRLSCVIDLDLKDELKTYGKYVRDWVVTNLSGKKLKMESSFFPQKDKYGRILGEIWFKDGDRWMSLNQTMLDSQLVVEYTGGDRAALLDQHITNMNHWTT